MTPKGNYTGVLAGVIVATVVSFVIASLILKTSKSAEEDDLSKAVEKTSALKGKEGNASRLLKTESGQEKKAEPEQAMKDVKKIIFACDAGMGSSAMGASILRNKVKKAGLDLDVSNTSINDLPSDADIVITHKDLTDRAKAKLPDAYHISVENFLNSPKYDELVEKLAKD
jgi:PTS system mannitol-specific IIC component